MTHKKPILVTGASSGIGNHLVHYLAQRGHGVYATVRNKNDYTALENIENITPLLMDVRNSQQISDAIEIIQQNGHGLYGVVNNAGIGELGFLSTWTDEEMFNIFDVNVFGPHRVTNACMDLLLTSQGRIVTIGSQGGIITSKMYGPYTMTKHAMEAYTDALSEELKPFGVHVSIVQPGGIITNVGVNSFEKFVSHLERARPPFDIEAKQILASFNTPREDRSNEPESATNRKPSSPEIVSAAVYDALFSQNPKLRYLVGTHWEGNRVIDTLIKKLLEENDNPQHNYSRDELVAIMDKLISERRTK